MGQTMHETVKAALIVSYIRDIGLFQNINECGNSGGKNKMSEMKLNICSVCGKRKKTYHYKEPSTENLPYQWCYITEEASGVHDSAFVVHTYNYILCNKCRAKLRLFLKGREK
jgi:hypothetical protein